MYPKKIISIFINLQKASLDRLWKAKSHKGKKIDISDYIILEIAGIAETKP